MEKESKARGSTGPGIGDVTDDYLLQRVSGKPDCPGKGREPEYVSKAGGKVHEAVPYSRRPYEHYDPAAMEQAMADFEQACASQGREEEVLRLYDAIVDEYDRLATLTYMAQLNYDRDVSDEQAAAEQAYTTDIYSEMGDKAQPALRRG